MKVMHTLTPFLLSVGFLVTPYFSHLAHANGSGGSCAANPPTFADGRVPLKNIYVTQGAAPGGNGSISAPFSSLIQAASLAQPGDDIVVSGTISGAHHLQLVGEVNRPIWISGAIGARLRGVGGPALKLSASRNVIVRNLEITESPNHVVHIDGNSSNIMLRDLYIHKATLACVKVSQSQRIYLRRSVVTGAGKIPGGNPVSQQIIDYVGVNKGDISDNEISDGPHQAIMLKGGTSDILVTRNEIHSQHSTQESAVGIGQWTLPSVFQPIDSAHEALRITFFANHVRNVSGPFVSFQGARDSAVIYNTFDTSGGGQMARFLPGSTGAGCNNCGESKNINNLLAGNIFVGGTHYGASLQCADSSLGGGNKVNFNIWQKPGGLNWWCGMSQDNVHSTYTSNPLLNSSGAPRNWPLVWQKGFGKPNNVAYSQYLTGDINGRCLGYRSDIGALQVSVN